MSIFEFCVIASGLDPSADDFESRFYDHGCDDATISFQKGHVIVDFAREAGSIESAIASAVECVQAAGAAVNRVEPDPLVSLAEIAARTGCSRAAISQYAKGQRRSAFPAPIAKVTTDSPLWDWAIVARWLFDAGRYDRDSTIAAFAVKEANIAIEAHDANFRDRLFRRVGECRAAI